VKKDKKVSAANGNVCGNCLVPENSSENLKLSACSRCGLVAYCSKDCQRAHWKASHKQYCVAKADRVPQQSNSTGSAKGLVAPNDANAGDKCAICLDVLLKEPASTLDCAHSFHSSCVAELKNSGVNQVCPLCRIPLQPGPEQLFEEATRRYMVVDRLVERGGASWSALPPAAQLEVEAAIAGWRAAAEQGSQWAQVNLAVQLNRGRGVEQNSKEAARWYMEPAEQGHSRAQFNLGVMFDEGRGVEQNATEALKWYKKSAGQGFTDAMFNLGVMFDKGIGVAQDEVEAARWFREAANLGHAVAQVNMAALYEEGRVVAKSETETARWFKMAAEQGRAEAQCQIGGMFLEGRGVAQSDAKALYWLKKAAIQGNDDAQNQMGNFFSQGRGVPRSDIEAARWYKKAADQGLAGAEFNLGLTHQERPWHGPELLGSSAVV